jgi:DNA-binding LacI/PurR family transcriptional regulator
MGKKAAEILIENIENENKTVKSKIIVLETNLIIRGST